MWGDGLSNLLLKTETDIVGVEDFSNYLTGKTPFYNSLRKNVWHVLPALETGRVFWFFWESIVYARFIGSDIGTGVCTILVCERNGRFFDKKTSRVGLLMVPIIRAYIGPIIIPIWYLMT